MKGHLPAAAATSNKHPFAIAVERTLNERPYSHNSSRFYNAMYRRTPASTGTHDLSTLEARGAAFVTVPRPRHRRRSPAPIARANESHSCSQLSGLNIFGISAYGIILIATALILATVLVVLIYIVTYISTHYVSQ